MVVATGFFDGVHTGHRLVISALTEAASARGEESMVVTFWPHPRNVLQQEAHSLRLLNSLSEKKELLCSLGVDHVEVLDFTRDFSRLTTEEYLREYVSGRFGGTAVVLGYDNRMGCDSTDPSSVAAAAERLGIDVIRTQMVSSPEGAVSSTRIRRVLEKGDVSEASAMLGYDYRLYGVVVSGNRIGRTLGYPTANMQLYEPLKLVPGNGVYFVRVNTLGRDFFGMCNIGNRPTIGKGNAVTIETNIFDFDEDIYGLDIQVAFMERIRGERCFGSMDELKLQQGKDKEECKKLIVNYGW